MRSNGSHDYAPILVLVYDRLEHLKKCINSLQACPDSENSVLYVASDYAYCDQHLELIASVRDYILSITGFKEVLPIFRPYNYGAARNAECARFEVFKKHSSIIMLEDDVVVGRGFLQFMNDGLRSYWHEPSIFAVCGYLPPGVNNMDSHAFFLNRCAPYGQALWRDKFAEFEALDRLKIINDNFKDFRYFREYERQSPHVVRAVPLLLHQGVRLGDVEMGLLMQACGLLALYPPTSITKSIGHDGSGLRSADNLALQSQKISDRYFLLDNGRSPEIKLSKEMSELAGQFRREPGVLLLNYIIFFLNKYVPRYYIVFFFIRSLVKSLKKRVKVQKKVRENEENLIP